MQPGARDDGWHTGGGCPLLLAAATLFGTRSAQVRIPGGAHDGASPSSASSCGRVVALEQKAWVVLHGHPVLPRAQRAPPRLRGLPGLFRDPARAATE
eukprot:7026096-Pyramimonas_sp.AAC.1